MRNSAASGFVVGVMLWASGCTQAALPKASTPNQTAKSAAPTQTSKGDSLYVKLRALPPAESLLAALPAAFRSQLETSLNQLDPALRREILNPDGNAFHVRPLLHLAAGGNELGAYTALFSTSAAGDELVSLAGPTGDGLALIRLSNAISKRAAATVLQARSADVAPGVTRRPEIVGEIAAAANILGDPALEQAALDALAELSESHSVRLRRIRLLCEGLDWQAAERLLTAEKSLADLERRDAESWIAAARTLSEQTPNSHASSSTAAKPAQAQSPASKVELARLALSLGRSSDATEILSKPGAGANDDLSYVTTRARASLGEGPCPGLRRELANAYLCRAAWREFRTSQSLAELEFAWQSGKGRDVLSVENYLGLVLVTQLMYGFDGAGGEASPESFKQTLRNLETRASEANSVGAHFKGVALMARALRLAFTASAEATDNLAAIAEADRTQMLADADALAASSPDEPFNQAAVLAVTGVLAQQGDGRSALLKLLGHVTPELLPPLGALLLWNQLASHDTTGYAATRNSYGELAQNPAVDKFERSRWLLLWAEAEAHLTPNDRSFATLQALSKQLKAKEMPLELQLRSAINLAGLDARRREFASAVKQLDDIVNVPRSSVETRQEQELLIAATGYHTVLQALAEPDSQPARAAELSQLLQNVTVASAASPALQVWLALWRGELETAIDTRNCRGNAACERRAQRARGIDRKLLSDSVGQRSAALMDLGVLAIGGVQVEFQYQRGRLIPAITVDSSFLLAHMPTIAK